VAPTVTTTIGNGVADGRSIVPTRWLYQRRYASAAVRASRTSRDSSASTVVLMRTTPSIYAWCPTPSLRPIGTMAIVVHTGITTIGIGVVLGRSHVRRLVLFQRSSARAVLPRSWIPRCSRASTVARLHTMHNMLAAMYLLRLAILTPFVASEAFLDFCDGGYLHACMFLPLQPTMAIIRHL